MKDTDVAPKTTSFLAGGGQLGDLIRKHSWETTPFGPVAKWSESLRSAVSICLGTKFPIAIYWGPELALLYNDAWSSILGEKHPWALGRPGREVWPEIWDAIGPLYETVQKTGEGVWQQDQLLLMHRHGYTEECYFNFTFSPIRGEGGRAEGIFNAVIETTFQVINQRRERTLRELAERIANARVEEDVIAAAAQTSADAHDIPFFLLYLCDGAGGVTLAAHSALNNQERAFRAQAHMADGSAQWPFAEVLETNDAVLVPHLTARFGFTFPGGPWPTPAQEALVLPIRSASSATGVTGFLVTGISPRRALDEDYRAFFDRAAAHIGAGLTNARAYAEERRRSEALAEIDRTKTAFFSNVSHEFRTPLTLMLAPLEELLEANDFNARDLERLNVTHRNAVRLLKLVNSLLDFSRIEAGRMQARFAPTDLAEYTRDLASSFRSAVEKAGLRLNVTCAPLPEAAYIDHDMWEKIVLNLLSNAFKFTFQGAITVDVRSEGGEAVLTVADTGTGIPARELPKLFDRFYRVEGAKGRSYEGSGIGLALVRELVTLHGGTIRVESAEGKGTVFIVSIPLGRQHLDDAQVSSDGAPDLRRTPAAHRTQAYIAEAEQWLTPDAAETRKTPAAPDAGPRGQGRILLADDNADMRGYITRLLESAGWTVEATPDGEAAVAAIERTRPDLILSDVMMPKLDGFGLLRHVRSRDDLARTPVILLSARAGEEARIDGLDKGADDYLVKPFSARELLSRVHSHVTLARTRREAEERFRGMADNAPVMVWVTEPDGSCSFLSKGWYDFTGQTPETGLGFGWLDATHPDDKDEAERIFVAANAQRAPMRLEYRLRRADGTYRWAIDAATPRIGDTGEFLGYIGSVVDITERKEAEDAQAQLNETLAKRVAEEIAQRNIAEENLRQAQKMEAIGRLTGGVAHDFNNLLTIVVGNIESMQRHMPATAPDRLRRSAENAMQGAKRAATLTQRLLAFSRRQPLQPKTIEPNKLISGMAELLTRTLGENISVETVLGAGLWLVEADPNQLESALLNLAVNANDAMPEGGKLTIETSNAYIDEAYAAKESEVRPGQYAVIAVSDTGKGMTKEILSQVFEPFFTTKPVGHGTGLGLAQVYGFVKQSGGNVKIYSEPNEGTTVKIYLPRFVGVVESEDITPQTIPDGAHSEIVLVVEDENGVREYSADILRELGYQVLEAANGPAALAQLDREPRITLLFTDVGLPGMNGRQLADEAVKRRPHIKVLFTTGYARNAIVHHGRLDPGVHMIPKPFTYADLAAKVRAVLDER